MTTRWETEISPLRRISFDSNALVYLLEDRFPYASYVAQAVAMLERGWARGVLSAITEMELLVQPVRERDAATVNRMQIFFQETPNLTVRPVDRVVARRAADVRARTRLARLDAIIVATALEERCDAIIGNDYVIASRSTGISYMYLNDYAL